MSAIFLQMSLFLPLSAWPATDQAWPIITFTCDKAKNEVKLKNEVKWGDIGKNFQFDPQLGTYNPWSLVKIESKGRGERVSPNKQLELNCLLGESFYRFVIKPKIFNTNFNAKCGNHLSVKVSVYKNRLLLVNDKPMETYCLGNAPVLRGLKIQGGNYKIEYYEVARSRFY